MKKTIVFLMGLVCAFSLTACGDESNSNTLDDSNLTSNILTESNSNSNISVENLNEDFFIGRWVGKAYYGDGIDVTSEVLENNEGSFANWIQLEINADNTLIFSKRKFDSTSMKTFECGWNYGNNQITFNFEEDDDIYTVDFEDDSTIRLTWGNDDKYILLSKEDLNFTSISVGDGRTVGLKSDGTVVAIGDNDDDGRCDVSGWTDIVAVSAEDYHTVGLKSDGTVVAVGNNEYGQCDISNWKYVHE